MSVGHVQRAVEAAGIPTTSVFVKSFGHLPGLMGLPRSLITKHPMGRPLGAPHDPDRQREVIDAALALLSVGEPTVVEFPYPYRAGV